MSGLDAMAAEVRRLLLTSAAELDDTIEGLGMSKSAVVAVTRAATTLRMTAAILLDPTPTGVISDSHKKGGGDDDATTVGEARTTGHPGDGADSHDVGGAAPEPPPAAEEAAAVVPVEQPPPTPRPAPKPPKPRLNDRDNPPPTPPGGKVTWIESRGLWRVYTAESVAKMQAANARRWGKEPVSTGSPTGPAAIDTARRLGAEHAVDGGECPEWIGIDSTLLEAYDDAYAAAIDAISVDDEPEPDVDPDAGSSAENSRNIIRTAEPEPPSKEFRPRSSTEHHAHQLGFEDGLGGRGVVMPIEIARGARTKAAYMAGYTKGLNAKPPVVVDRAPTPVAIAGAADTVPDCPNTESVDGLSRRCSRELDHPGDCAFPRTPSRLETTQVVPVPGPAPKPSDRLDPAIRAEVEAIWARNGADAPEGAPA